VTALGTDTSERAPWRLIISGPVDGAWNMAIDRAVLECHAEGTSPPTVRLYSWDVPTVTLGRFQKVEDVDVALALERGFDVVRRPTGGRGVLHDDEITYSFVAGTTDGVPRGVAASYRWLSAALVSAFTSLGVVAQLTARERGGGEAARGACYLHATQADLSVGAAKLSGSAQVWKSDAVLQHGSFVISRDPDLEARLFRLGPDGAAALSAEATTLLDALGSRPSPAAVVDAVSNGVKDAFVVDLFEGRLTDQEVALAASLVGEMSVARPGGDGRAPDWT
jgi:lipoate-protein ligase A